MDAAMRSKGSASAVIHKAVLATLSRYGAGGALLDLGAGQGNLTKMLHQAEMFDHISCIDITDQPSDLSIDVEWRVSDLNEDLPFADESFDTVVASEVIEHLENPRALCREVTRVMRPKGLLVVSTPNCENIRSFVALFVRGHHWAFGSNSYPAHITALCRIDLERAAREAGLMPLEFCFTDDGGIPGRPSVKWQRVSFGLLRGLRFSDNVIFVANRASE